MHAGRGARWDAEAMETAKSSVEKRLAILERQLGSNEYLVANRCAPAEFSYARSCTSCL
jgi:hypothetical protein